MTLDRDAAEPQFTGFTVKQPHDDGDEVPLYVRGWCEKHCETYGACGWLKKNCGYYGAPQWMKETKKDER